MDLSKILIWLDAGHGGHDSGALSPSGLKESDIALVVCQLAQRKLKELGLWVMMSRERDVFIPLWQRSSMANDAGAGLFVSVHLNSADRTASGIETYAMLGSKSGERLANALQDEQLDAFPSSNDRGVKYKAFSVLRKTKMPAALVELEFIHTDKGDDHFRDSENIEKHADAIVAGVCKYIGFEAKKPAKMVAKGERQKPEASATLLENRVKHLESENETLRLQVEALMKENKISNAKIVEARKALG